MKTAAILAYMPPRLPIVGGWCLEGGSGGEASRYDSQLGRGLRGCDLWAPRVGSCVDGEVRQYLILVDVFVVG